MEIFGVSLQALLGQMLFGLVNGAFYSMLSLGLALIFGLLGIVNFVHGALFMLGAFAAWMLHKWVNVNFWIALLLAPLLMGFVGAAIERFFLTRLYGFDPVYGLLLTFGFVLVIENAFREWFGAAGNSYPVPQLLRGSIEFGETPLPIYRLFVVSVSVLVALITWLTIEKTRLGALLRAGTENSRLVQSFGVNVPRLVTLTYAVGAGLAGLGGVLAAPIMQVSPFMGSNLVIIVFAVVVIGGMGSIVGAAITGLGIGLIESVTKVYYPSASNIVIFVIMGLVLMARPAGLFGRQA